MVLLDRAAQSPHAVSGKLPDLLCRCTLHFDQCGGLLGRQGAQFLGIAPRHRRLCVHVAGFAVGADEPCSYRVTTHPFDPLLSREQREAFAVVLVFERRPPRLRIREAAVSVDHSRVVLGTPLGSGGGPLGEAVTVAR